MRKYRIAPRHSFSKIRLNKWTILGGFLIVVVVYYMVLRNPNNGTDSQDENEIPLDLNKPIILEWSHDPPEHLTTFLDAYPDNPHNKCPYECYFTSNRKILMTASMVVFHPVHLTLEDLNDLPPKRCSNQLYVFFTRESPQNMKGSEYKKLPHYFFNVSMTYRLDSDIYAGYDRFEEIDNFTKGYEIWTDSEITQKISKKKKMVLQFISNCNTPSSRETYISELEKYVNISKFGTCYEGLIHRILNKHDCTGACEDDQIDQHYFYLAFENSVCKHYASEKFWRLKKLIVPIVLKRSYYEGIAPNNSFIAVDDFESPIKLATYLHYLTSHMDEYMKYFQWTKTYKKTKGYFDARCKLCTLASTGAKARIPDIKKWWDTDSQCIRDYGKILLNNA